MEATIVLKLQMQMLRIQFRSELDNLTEFLRDIHWHNLKEKKALEEEFSKLSSEADRDEYIQAYEDTYQRFKSDFPRVIDHTAFIAIYSVLETTIKRLYQLVEEHKTGVYPKFCNYATKKYYENLKRFASSSDWSKLDTEFDEIEKYALVRNSMIHNSCIINESKHPVPLRSFLQLHSATISIASDTEFVVSDSAFVSTFCKLSESFLLGLFEKTRSGITNSIRTH